MINALLTSAALLGTSAVALGGIGSAVVVNSCSYPVSLANTPSAGGGYSAIDQTLQPGGSYSQVFTQLSNGNGWSLKLTKSAGATDVLQYEYTFHDDGTLWYDLSEVNGNPWDGNWEITATGDCTPRQAAYRYSTDDAYGMQSCPDTSSVTVTLCSGDSGSGSPGSSSPAESAAPTSTWGSSPTSEAPAPTSAPPAESSPPAQSAPWNTWGGVDKAAVNPEASTFATVNKGDGVTVTNVHTVVETKYITATADHVRRHAHHHRH